ncbi:MAG: S8 family serine peptidase [Pyrinomonadaceae bacterium]
MERRIAVMAAVVFLFSLTVFGQYSRKKYSDTEILVKPSVSTSESFFSLRGFEGIQRLKNSEWIVVKLGNKQSVEDSVTALSAEPSIAAAQPNFFYYLDEVPDDTRYSELWGMQKISAPAAWDVTHGNSDVVVAIIDSGAKYDHPDLEANMWINPNETPGNGIDDDQNGYVDDVHGYDFRFDDPDPWDEHGHGTHVAGTVGAVGNNALGVVGVNWNVKIIPVKIYDSIGFNTTSTMLINAYNYVRILRERGVNIRVTNNSYGGCDEACDYDQATKDAIDALGKANILNVFSAGNDNTNIDSSPSYPASYNSPSIISIASSTSSDARSSFSNFGIQSVDLAAPGSSILSTVFNGTGYGTKSGTSMSSPHVTGTAALLVANDPSISNATIKARLINSVDQLAAWGSIVRSGGRLNAASALANNTSCDFTPTPASQHAFPEGGTFSFTVNAANGCDFDLTPSENWIQITSDSPSTGTTTVTYTVAPNSSLPRTGNISIGGTVFTVNQNPGKISPQRGFIDFDGDGMTDLAEIRDSSGQMNWHYNAFGLEHETPFGLSADDIAVPGNYDSDLRTDIAVWRRSTGTFYVLNSSDSTVTVMQFGLNGDNPLVTQDFDGDDKNDFAVTRAQGGHLIWYIFRSSDSQVSILQYGLEGDIPIRGDYDGDGKADPAVYRPEGTIANTFYVLRSTDNILTGATFGDSTTDDLLPNDFDGDGKTDFAVWRRTTGVWYVLRSTDFGYHAAQFGSPGDVPTPGDYDGDGRTDYSVYRPATGGGIGTHYRFSLLSGINIVNWGDSDSIKLANQMRTP